MFDDRHTLASDSTADVHFPRPSRAKQRRSVQDFRLRARRADGGLRRDCPHPGQPHRHGTRTAYVKDRCRCRDCRDANTAASRSTARAQTFGSWQPYIDATPVREHIAYLRAHDIGMTQIAKLAQTSLSHIRQLVGTTPDGRPTTLRVRPFTAERILAIEPSPASVAPSARIDATGTRRRLQALVAVGFPIPFLAAQLGRTPVNLARTFRRASVYASTADQVDALYERLWDTSPPHATEAQRSASARARAEAQRHGWRPPLGWDDIDTDPDTDPDQCRPDPERAGAATDDIDEIAVDRAVAGDGIRLSDLTPAEQAEAVRRLTERGRSIREIAEQLATTTRTVSRRRRALVTPPSAGRDAAAITSKDVADLLDVVAQANSRLSSEVDRLLGSRAAVSGTTVNRLVRLADDLRPGAAAGAELSELAHLDTDVLVAGMSEWLLRRRPDTAAPSAAASWLIA